MRERESECVCVSVFKEPINHSTLKTREPDAFTLITSGHPITFKHQSRAGAEVQEPPLPISFSLSLLLCVKCISLFGRREKSPCVCVLTYMCLCARVCFEASEVTFLCVRATASSLR